MTEELHNREVIHAGGLTFVRRRPFPYRWEAGDFALSYKPGTETHTGLPFWYASVVKHYFAEAHDDIYDMFAPCRPSPEDAIAALQANLVEDMRDVGQEIDCLRARMGVIGGLLKALEVSDE